MAFPLRGVPHGTDEVITFPGVASSPEESAISEHAQEDPVNSDHVREAPIDLSTNSDNHTSPIDKGSPVHEHVFEPDDNLLSEVDRAETEVLDDESTSSDMRVPQPTIITSITQPFPTQTEMPFQTSLTANMGVQTTLAQSPSREILGTSTSPHIVTEGGDVGTQYRSGIYYYNEEQARLAQESMEAKQKEFKDNKIVTEILPAKTFYRAEEYHQQYLEKGGGQGCKQSASKGCNDPIRCYG